VTFKLAAERLSKRATDIVRLCAFLSPEAILQEILTAGKDAEIEFLDAMAEAAKYSLVERDSRERVVDMHRLVQEVIRDGMNAAARRKWAERAVEAVEAAFPSAKFETWPVCERLLPHARFSARWIAEHKLDTQIGARLLNRTALYFERRAQYQEAEPLYLRALETDERVLGKEHPDRLLLVNNLAMLLEAKGDLVAAELMFQRALETRGRVLGMEHPDTLTSVHNLAGLLYIKEDLAGAEALYRRAMEGRMRVLGEEDPDTLRTANNLAAVFFKNGNLSAAKPLYRRTLDLQERVPGKEHPDTLHTVNNLAKLLRAEGDLVGAEPLLRRALEGFSKALGPDHPTTKITAKNLAQCVVELGNRG
jgi:tetratricopeptide (TPR) repeat protein